MGLEEVADYATKGISILFGGLTLMAIAELFHIGFKYKPNKKEPDNSLESDLANYQITEFYRRNPHLAHYKTR